MNSSSTLEGPEDKMLSDAAGRQMMELVERLYPICRSITGEGVRETLGILRERIPLELHEVETGARVFDWEVPREWNIREAYIEDPSGNRVVDFRRHNLHVMSYSTPVDETMSLDELRTHLHSLPEHPEWIPYRTSYYNEDWGFCLAHKTFESLKSGDYRVLIDSTLEPGSLTYGELAIPGEEEDEILFFTHVCHPSLCNDNLSGIVVQARLAELLAGRRGRYTYRFVFAPGTIGSITWLSRNYEKLNKVRGGLVLALLGDPGQFTYKQTRDADAWTDRVVTQALVETGVPHRLLNFSPYGYDERQFGSPGIAMPIGRLTRTPNGEYPEYHSSADNLSFVTGERLQESLRLVHTVIQLFEQDRIYINTEPNCEPHLGKRGLYSRTGGMRDIGEYQHALLWLLNQSDGSRSIIDIARRSGLPFATLTRAAHDLEDVGLLEEKVWNSGEQPPPRQAHSDRW